MLLVTGFAPANVPYILSNQLALSTARPLLCCCWVATKPQSNKGKNFVGKKMLIAAVIERSSQSQTDSGQQR